MSKSIKSSYILGIIVLLIGSLWLTWPTLARLALEYYAPREVETWPVDKSKVIYKPAPDKPRLIEKEELERLIGFTLLEPAWLPPNCPLKERFYIPAANGVATTNYTCVSISQQRGETIQQPYVGKDSVEELTIGGQLAFYIDGAWAQLPGEEEVAWHPGFSQMIVFERDGVIIEVIATPQQLAKEKLIKVAESLERRENQE